MSGDDADLKVGSTSEGGISDTRLDRALRTLIDRNRAPIDLRARVMAAIDAPIISRTRSPWRFAAAAAFCIAAVLLAAAIAMWSGIPDVGRDSAARDAGAGAARGRDPRDPAALTHPTDAREAQTTAAEYLRSRHPVRQARRPASAAADRRVASWHAALPPLAPPDRLAVEQMDEPPVQVVQLRIERLSIDPLELDPLDRGREE